MPMTKFKHPLTREPVPLGHFATDTQGLKGRSAWPPWAGRFVEEMIRDDVRHTGTMHLTATRCLGCPRETFLQAVMDYAVEPGTRWVMDHGSMMHWVAARFMPEGYITEHTHPEALTIRAKLFGTLVDGKFDAARIVDGRLTELIDHKFPREGSAFYREKKFPDERKSYIDAVGTCDETWAKLDHAMQLNIGRLLLAQNEEAFKEAGIAYDPADVLLTIWDYASGTSKSPKSPKALEAPHMTEMQMLRAKPAGGQLTVGDIVEVSEAMNEAWNDLPVEERTEAKGEEIAAQVPLVGQMGMFGGKKCGSYCDVEGICSRLVREHGVPSWEV